jgi:NADPH-dependent curcumin reductase CurA
MDADLAFHKPKNISIEQAASLGVGTLTAGLSIFEGLNVKYPEPGQKISAIDEWVVIFGGAGSVGQYAVQLATIGGYKVVATCSGRTSALVKSHGASATVDYNLSPAEQIEQIINITDGKFRKVFDAVAKNTEIALYALKKSTMDDKRFSTTDDWSPIDPVPGIEFYRTALGPIGRGEDLPLASPYLNSCIVRFIPRLVAWVEEGSLKPNEVEIIDGGFNSIKKAIDLTNSGKGAGKKYVVRME